jgi:hypothetical protein
MKNHDEGKKRAEKVEKDKKVEEKKETTPEYPNNS